MIHLQAQMRLLWCRHHTLATSEECAMPVLARFYGLIVKMYFQQSEHNPPHVHVVYGEFVGIINIQTSEMIEGDLPDKALSFACEWVDNNRDALLEIWETQVFRQLPPLV
jgi:hypothetical protein